MDRRKFIQWGSAGLLSTALGFTSKANDVKIKNQEIGFDEHVINGHVADVFQPHVAVDAAEGQVIDHAAVGRHIGALG